MVLMDEIKNLKMGQKITVMFFDDTTLTGELDTYTSAIDNDPAIASIDLRTKEGLYELYENEIKSIEIID